MVVHNQMAELVGLFILHREVPNAENINMNKRLRRTCQRLVPSREAMFLG